MAEIRRLFHPALAYMFMPLAQAVMIQGPVLVIGHILDPVMVVTFATSRTLARLGTAGTNMLTNSFITEFAARAGQGDRVGFAALFRTELLLCGVAITGYVAGIILLDDRLMHLFTHGKVPILEPFSRDDCRRCGRRNDLADAVHADLGGQSASLDDIHIFNALSDRDRRVLPDDPAIRCDRRVGLCAGGQRDHDPGHRCHEPSRTVAGRLQPT